MLCLVWLRSLWEVKAVPWSDDCDPHGIRTRLGISAVHWCWQKWRRGISVCVSCCARVAKMLAHLFEVSLGQVPRFACWNIINVFSMRSIAGHGFQNAPRCRSRWVLSDMSFCKVKVRMLSTPFWAWCLQQSDVSNRPLYTAGRSQRSSSPCLAAWKICSASFSVILPRSFCITCTVGNRPFHLQLQITHWNLLFILPVTCFQPFSLVLARSSAYTSLEGKHVALLCAFFLLANVLSEDPKTLANTWNAKPSSKLRVNSLWTHPNISAKRNRNKSNNGNSWKISFWQLVFSRTTPRHTLLEFVHGHLWWEFAALVFREWFHDASIKRTPCIPHR